MMVRVALATLGDGSAVLARACRGETAFHEGKPKAPDPFLARITGKRVLFNLWQGG